MSYRVFVDGHEGTTGLQIHERLAARADVEMLRIDTDKRKDPAARAQLLNAADVAFLCLPDGAAREAVALVENPATCVIDASTAHRIAPGWVFGLPEMAAGQRAEIRTAKRIANPGCHATGFILLIRPLVDAGLIDAGTALTATSITGYSGAGKKMIEQYDAGGDPRLNAPRPYALSLVHKHLPEMRQYAALQHPPVFTPIVGPFYKGLAVSVPLHRSQILGDPAALHAALAQHYSGEQFVRVMPLADPPTLEDGFFDVQACNDTNRCDLFVFGRAEQVLLIARLDNLGKGASGAAVQAMNLHLGCDEGLAL